MKKTSSDVSTIGFEIGAAAGSAAVGSDATYLAQEHSKALKSFGAVIKVMEGTEKTCRGLILKLKVDGQDAAAKALHQFLSLFSEGLDEAKVLHQRFSNAKGSSVEEVREIHNAQSEASKHLLGLKSKMEPHTEKTTS